MTKEFNGFFFLQIFMVLVVNALVLKNNMRTLTSPVYREKKEDVSYT